MESVRDWARNHTRGFNQLAEKVNESQGPTNLLLRALYGNGNESVCASLKELIESDDDSIRYHLAGVCKEVDNGSSREILSKLVSDRELVVALHAIEVLSSFSSNESSEIRLRHFNTEDRYQARIAYLEGLFRNPDDRFSEILPNLIANEDDPTIQFYALAALKLINPARASTLQVDDEYVSSIQRKLNLTYKESDS